MSSISLPCRGDGYFEGPGNYTMDYGTFNGYGLINGSSGSYTGAPIKAPTPSSHFHQQQCLQGRPKCPGPPEE